LLDENKDIIEKYKNKIWQPMLSVLYWVCKLLILRRKI
jgi:hypothetical protein